MKKPAPASRSFSELKSLTPARVGLGRSGASLPTEALLDFTLAHARARDAVHADFDSAGIAAALGDLGLPVVEVRSRAGSRRDYLRRPDLGRLLDQASRHLLASQPDRACQLVLVVGDGLSPAAVNRHALPLIRALKPRLAAEGIEIGQAVVATGTRVALGDEIGLLLGARMTVMLVGERPGLSAPDSLGAYLTFAPQPGRTDAERNCVSNIHGSGLGYDEAAFTIAWLVRVALSRQLTGVALKDESGGPRRLAGQAAPSEEKMSPNP